MRRLTLPGLVPRSISLHEAAATIFALVAVLPLLLFLYLLTRSDLLTRTESQVAVLMAIFLALLGFVVFRRMASQISGLAQSVRAPDLASGVVPQPIEAQAAAVPGLGRVADIGEIADAFNHLLENLRGSTERLEDLVFKLGTLNETVELSARIPRAEDLLALVLDRTMRAVGATIGSIMLLDRERRTLRVAAARGLPDEARAGAEVRVGEGIAGRVAELGEPILVDDIETDPRVGKANDPRYGTGSFICMPVRAGERIVGVINLARKDDALGGRPRTFGASDLHFLNTLVTHVGYAVENARLLEEARESAKRLQEVVDHLKATQAQLVRGETLGVIGQMASGMAHHLNNLFAVISGRVELLLRRITEPEVRGYLQVVLRTVKDGAEVVRRVQRFSRTQPISEPESVDLNQVAQEVIELTRPRWHDQAQLQGVAIEVALEAGSVPAVAGEPAPLREVLMNLILNAIDALPKGGLITVRTWAAEPWVFCVVSDNGVGMADEVRRRAFDPFFTTKGPMSTGLGLSVNYGIIERHGGETTIQSAEGRGTTVTIKLRPSSAPPRVAAPPSSAPARPLRVLVVDDHGDVRASLAEILAADGHTVVQAAAGREALALLEAGESVDVVVTDLGMPGMTGWDVARAIKERWPELPVGLVTGWEPEASGAERARIDFVIAKPFDVATVRAALAPFGRRDITS